MIALHGDSGEEVAFASSLVKSEVEFALQF
jgi:hypothetical protein